MFETLELMNSLAETTGAGSQNGLWVLIALILSVVIGFAGVFGLMFKGLWTLSRIVFTQEGHTTDLKEIGARQSEHGRQIAMLDKRTSILRADITGSHSAHTDDE